MDPHHFDADADPDPACHFDSDPDPTFYLDADMDPDLEPSFHIKAQNLEKNAQIGSDSIHLGLTPAN